MRLNPDCIRDILLSVEEATEVNILFEYDRDDRGGTRLGKYDHDVIRYHIRQCKWADLIVGYTEWECASYIKIHDLTPAGHAFLSNIRSDTIWKKAREMLGSLNISDLTIIVQLAQKAAQEVLKLI